MAPSFADIFCRNCANNGLLLIKLQETVVDRLFREIAQTIGYRLAVDLETQTVSSRHGEVIREYEKRRMRETPWLFQDMTKPPS
jgi:3-isopropylmalate/(R)-2-methylmalate dehydratase small subunit